MPSEKVAVMFAPRRTPVALTAGVRAFSFGATLVVKDHETSANWFPAASRIKAAPPSRVTVYLVSCARLTVGLRIHWRALVVLRVTDASTRAPAALVNRKEPL